MRTASRGLSFTFSRRIPQVSLKRLNENSAYLRGISVGAAAHELYFADRSNNLVRSFDVRSSKLDVRDAYRAERVEDVKDVAYSPESDTLFVSTRSQRGHDLITTVRLFLRTSNEWREFDRVQYQTPGEFWHWPLLRVVSGETLLCGTIHNDFINVYRVSANHSMLHSGRLQFPIQIFGFDIQQELEGKQTLLAAVLVNGSVALYRVNSFTDHSMQLLSLVALHNARSVLFARDTLIIGVSSFEGYYFDDIFAFSIIGNRLKSERQLIARAEGLEIRSWCFVNGTLFAWDYVSRDLFIYNMN